MRVDTTTLRPAAGALGLFALMAAGGVYLIFNDFNVPVRVLLVAGVLLLGVFVALNPEDVLQRLTAQKTLYSGNTALMVIAFLGILAVINALGTRFSERWDLTESRQFTLSEKTLGILENLDQPVHVTGFFSSADISRSEAEDLLKEYQVRSNGQLTYEFVDPEVEPAKAISLGVRDFGTLVFQQGGKRQNVTGLSEQDFTSALLKLTRPEPKKIYFTQGHGERNLDGADREGYAQVRQLLQQDNYEVRMLNLMTEQRVPLDAALVVIAGPTSDFLPEEKRVLQDYLASGGKLLLMQDPRVEVNLNDLFSQWRISVGKDPVIDPGSNLLGDARTPAVQRYGFHTITDRLRTFSFFPFAAAINYPKEPLEGVTITPLVQTTDRSWVETDPQTAQYNEETDQRGPVALAVALEASATNPDPARSASGDPARVQKTRVVVIGTARFIENEFLNVPSANVDIFLNSVNWLAEAEDLITIQPKERDNRQMFLTNVQMNLILFTSTIFLPLVVVAAGALVWWSRR